MNLTKRSQTGTLVYRANDNQERQLFGSFRLRGDGEVIEFRFPESRDWIYFIKAFRFINFIKENQ